MDSGRPGGRAGSLVRLGRGPRGFWLRRRVFTGAPALPAPTGRLSAAMLAELKRQTPEVVYLMKLVVGGAVRLFGEVGAAWGPDLVEPKVISWGAVSRGVGLRQNTLEMLTVDVMVDDTDQSLAALLESSQRNALRGAPVTLYLASPNVSPADWYVRFAGRLDTFAQSAPLLWTFTIAPYDLPLRRESVPKGTITNVDWPNAKVDVRDLPLPILYGRISSAGGSNAGAIPALYVDTVQHRYLVCAGWALAVDKVYKDGVGVSAASYSLTHPVVNGRQYTLLEFTANQGLTSAITCDVQGYEAVGDGTGSLIVDPATMLKHALVNWVYGDYRSGPWLADSSAPVDLGSFATTFFSDRDVPAQASWYINRKRKGLDVVNEFLSSFEMKACWTADGKIALKVEDFTDWTYEERHILREDEVGGWSLPYATMDLVDEIEGKYGLIPTAGDYSQALKVKDFATGELAPDTLELPASPAFIL